MTGSFYCLNRSVLLNLHSVAIFKDCLILAEMYIVYLRPKKISTQKCDLRNAAGTRAFEKKNHILCGKNNYT